MSDASSKFAEELRRSRERGGLGSIDSAAKKLGVARGSLGGYERGERLPDIDFLARLARETNSDFNELLRLRIEAGGNSPDALGIAVQDVAAGYGNFKVQTRSGSFRSSDAQPITAEIRREVQQAGLSLDWALLIVELVAGGDLQPGGARAIIEFLKQANGDGNG